MLASTGEKHVRSTISARGADLIAYMYFEKHVTAIPYQIIPNPTKGEVAKFIEIEDSQKNGAHIKNRKALR